MGIKEKLAHAKKTDWIREGFTDEEVREIVASAKNEARNFRKELEAENSEKNVKEENQAYFFKNRRGRQKNKGQDHRYKYCSQKTST